MSAVAQIIEMDQERDRKICISLELKVSGANRELAQWLLDHPRYSGADVAGWLGCSKSRINDLRAWAARDFSGSPRSNESRPSTSDVDRRRETLKTNDNSEFGGAEHDEDGVVTDDDSDIASPDQIEDNILYAIQRINENARVFNKILKASALDRQAADRINTALDRMIQKWRSIQSTLEKKGK